MAIGSAKIQILAEGRQANTVPSWDAGGEKEHIQRNSAVDAGYDIDSMWQKFLLSISKT